MGAGDPPGEIGLGEYAERQHRGVCCGRNCFSDTTGKQGEYKKTGKPQRF
jgi:hypothetical protein